MAIDSHYIPAFSIEDVLLDKDTGAPLSGGLVYFEKDEQRGVLKPIYQITGTSPDYSYIQLPNPMTLSAIGTFEDALDNPTVPYFYPYDANGNVELYYVRVTSADDVPQFDREAVPYVPSSGNSSVISAFENEISNPQFAEVLFESPTTFTFNGVTDEVITIAPGWDIVLTSPGVGSLTLSIVTPTGSLNRITNPGTLLNVTSTGLSSLRLRQRLYGSPNLWGSGYLAVSFIAKTYSGTSSSISMYYSQSNGTVVNELLKTAILTSDGLYQAYPGSALIPASTSTEFFPDSYVEIYFDLPLTTEIDISSVMVVFTNNVSVDNILYDQTSLDRQIDYLFHYYKPQLDFKPIPSYLVGWDFPLNPTQLGSSKTINGTPAYIWDQTICASSSGNITVVRSAANTNAFYATTTADNQAFYLLQYLSDGQGLELSMSRLAVNIHAYCLTHPGVVAKVYLYAGDGSSSIPIIPTTIGTIASSGEFTLTAANWSLISQLITNNTGTLFGTSTADPANDLKFSGWNPTYGGVTNFAIVVTFAVPTSGTATVIQSISCVPGDIPTRPAPQTADQVLRECQYYYEKSYPVTISPGAVGGSLDGLVAEQLIDPASNGAPGTNTYDLTPRAFGFKFNVQKIKTPTIVLYSPTSATTDRVRGHIWNNGADANSGDIAASTNWTINPSTVSVNCIPSTVTGFLLTGAIANHWAEAFITYQFTADARLGVV